MQLTEFYSMVQDWHMKITRYLASQIQKDLREKMIFLGGPRQVGKTTLAKSFLRREEQYLNWDKSTDRQVLLREELDTSQGLLVLDEIHKYRRWRGLIKGYYDKFFPKLNFIVTGSARLDYLRKGGDSLLGRYHYLRLHPLSLNEISTKATIKDLSALMTYGGFPEPFLKQDEIFHRRWQLERISKVIRQDLPDVEAVKDLSLVELLAQNLPSRVGSGLSIKSLQEDLQVSPNTVERWISILETLYYCYRIPPYGPAKVKAVKKTPKLYLWDWSEVELPGSRFENLVASQLLKYCHFQQDCLGLKTELRYFKDVVTGREIDFVVIQKGKPLFAVECKTGESQLSKALLNNGARLKIPALYQVHMGKTDYGSEARGRILPFTTFARELGLP